MSIQIRQPGRIETAVTLSIAQLEELVTVAREHGMVFSLDRFHDKGYRYYLDASGDTTALRSNDIGDVARYLGLTQPLAEAGVIPDSTKPTEYVVNGTLHYGAVPLQQRTNEPFDPALPLPRNSEHHIDRESRAFRARRWALHLKSGYGTLDCIKALIQKDGDATEAHALLVATRGFARTKV